MKNHILFLITCIILFTFSCKKENELPSKTKNKTSTTYSKKAYEFSQTFKAYRDNHNIYPSQEFSLDEASEAFFFSTPN